MSPEFTLPANPTKGDFDRIDKMLTAQETAEANKANHADSERDEFEEIHDPSGPTGKVSFSVRVEEFRCQEQGCENEFEKIIREPMA